MLKQVGTIALVIVKALILAVVITWLLHFPITPAF